MNYTTSENQRMIPANVTDVQSGETIILDAPAPSVMVAAESSLSDMDDYPPGTFAYTAGFQAMWQKGADGTWVSLM